MAFNKAPTEVFAGWSEDETNITLPIASVPELTAAEADAVSGDSRKILFALLEAYQDWLSGLAEADRPTKLSMTATNGAPIAGVYKRTFVIRFDIPTGPVEVADE